MANRNNKICICCSKPYEFCTGCAKDNEKPSWMNIYCSENCRSLFQGATDYRAGEITKDQAKKIVDNADLTNEKNFKDSIKKFIKEFKEEKKTIVTVEKNTDVKDKSQNNSNTQNAPIVNHIKKNKPVVKDDNKQDFINFKK